MVAVGDARNRILALARDQRSPLTRLLGTRLPAEGNEAYLLGKLDTYVQGTHALQLSCRQPCTRVTARLNHFLKAMPDGFDLRKASIGNLFLTSSYLEHGTTASAFDELSELVDACGIVRTATDVPAHLCARLADGSTVVGQHKITGKETAAPASPIESIFLSTSAERVKPDAVPASEETLSLVRRARLIVFSPGSFYSSVLANLLPTGMVEALRANPCPKLFIPNFLPDPETPDMSVADRVGTLLRYMSTPSGMTVDLDAVIVDPSVDYSGGMRHDLLETGGVTVREHRLCADSSAKTFDAPALLDCICESL